MPIKLIPADDYASWSEPEDAVRVEFDSSNLLEQAGMSIEDAYGGGERFAHYLTELLEQDSEAELRSPGPRYGPDAGGGIDSFLDVVVGTAGVLGAIDVAARIVRKLAELGTGARVSQRAIEILSRQQLRFHGHPESSTLVGINLIPIESQLTGPPPGYLGFAAVFRLDDDRLVTMRWSLDALIEDYSEGASDAMWKRVASYGASPGVPSSPSGGQPGPGDAGVQHEFEIRTARALRIRVLAESAEEALRIGGAELIEGDEGNVILADGLPVGSE